MNLLETCLSKSSRLCRGVWVMWWFRHTSIYFRWLRQEGSPPRTDTPRGRYVCTAADLSSGPSRCATGLREQVDSTGLGVNHGERWGVTDDRGVGPVGRGPPTHVSVPQRQGPPPRLQVKLRRSWFRRPRGWTVCSRLGGILVDTQHPPPRFGSRERREETG